MSDAAHTSHTTEIIDRPLTEIFAQVKEYVSRMSNLQKQINDTKESVKDLEDEYKSSGIPVSKVKKIISTIKREMKMSPADRAEMEQFRELIMNDPEMLNSISEMIVVKGKKK